MAIAIRQVFFFILGILLFILIEPAVAQTANTSPTALVSVKTLWLIVAGSLVFFMNAGFAM
ncbi:MAG: ammonium permease, partial [Cyanobacteria bacterium J06621_12]